MTMSAKVKRQPASSGGGHDHQRKDQTTDFILQAAAMSVIAEREVSSSGGVALSAQ